MSVPTTSTGVDIRSLLASASTAGTTSAESIPCRDHPQRGLYCISDRHLVAGFQT